MALHAASFAASRAAHDINPNPNPINQSQNNKIKLGGVDAGPHQAQRCFCLQARVSTLVLDTS
jgi:hypothetical protein